MEENKFLKVKTAIMMQDKYVLSRNENATFVPSDEFRNMVNDKDEQYRSKIITFINEAIGLDWAVRFAPFTDEIHDVYIFCNNEYEYAIIRGIIIERITDTRLIFQEIRSIEDVQNLW